jgi:plastocyanin
MFGHCKKALYSRMAAAILLAAVAISGCAADVEEPVVVSMDNMLKFIPAEVTISSGTAIEWQNTSLLVHTVTADPAKAARPESTSLPEGAEPFDSGNLEPDGNFRHRFTVPGSYRYFCIPHEGAAMIGTVVVKP